MRRRFLLRCVTAVLLGGGLENHRLHETELVCPLKKDFAWFFSKRLKDSAYHDSVFPSALGELPWKGVRHENCGPYLVCGLPTRRNPSRLCILQQRRGRISRKGPGTNKEMRHENFAGANLTRSARRYRP